MVRVLGKMDYGLLHLVFTLPTEKKGEDYKRKGRASNNHKGEDYKRKGRASKNHKGMRKVYILKELN